MFKKILVLLICFLSIFSISCADFKARDKINLDKKLIYEYEDKDINYKIINNEMVDTYLIATALYMDFKSDTVLLNTDEHLIYKNVKEFFIPFKNHEFLKNFDKYVFNKDINGDVIGVILSYSNDNNLEKLHDVDSKYRNGIFKDQREIDLLIEGLKSFYEDTNAKKYFEDNNELLLTANAYINDNIKNTKVIELIKTMEEYLNTKDKYYKDKKIEYEVVLTLYRPSMASFYSYQTKDTNKIINFGSVNDFTRNPYKFDINYMVENTIHEYLHSYINKPVYDITIKNYVNDDIRNMDLTTNNIYKNMPIYRQLDEYLVRAIEGRIYTKIFDKEYTFNRILDKEIKYGGFESLEYVYNYLLNYENKDEFKDIDDFLPQIIDILIKKFI